MDSHDLYILRDHIEFLRRMTANSKQSHGWTFDDEIPVLERALESLSQSPAGHPPRKEA